MNHPAENVSRNRSLVERIWPFLVLAALVAVLFHPFFLKGWVLDGNHDRRDLVLPFHVLHMRAFSDFSLPHWNPYIFCGKNAHGSALYPIFYPPYWPAYLLGEDLLPASLTVILLIHVLLAGFFSFLFFRRISGEGYWALLASVIYILSSASVMQMTAGTINYAAFTFLPLLLYLAAASEGRSAGENAAIMAVAVALMLLSANVQLSAYCLAIFLAYGFWRSWETRSRAPALSAFLGAALGVAVSCIRYVPFWFALKAQGGETMPYEELKAAYSNSPWHFLRLWTPEIYGARLHSGSDAGINHFEVFSTYIGVPCALIALFALLFAWNRKTAFFQIVVLFIMATLLGTPLLHVHHLAFGKSEILFNRLAWFLPLCFGALMATHARAILSERKKAFLAFSALALAGAGTGLHFMVTAHFPQEFRDLVGSEIRFSIVHFIAFGLASLAAFLLRAEGRFFKAVLLLLVAADLLIVASIESRNSNPFFSPAPLFQPCEEEAGLAEVMRQTGNTGRIVALPYRVILDPTTIWSPNDRYLPLGIGNSSGYDNLAPPAIAELYRYPWPGRRAADRTVMPFNHRAMLLSSTAFCTNGRFVWANLGALERWRLFTEYEVKALGKETLDRITAPEFPLQDLLVLDREPELPIRPSPIPGGVSILEQGENRFVIQVLALDNVLLLVNDTRDPGWKASLDGRPAPILSANSAFMALAVPEGIHTVEMRFTPRGWHAGLAVTALGCAALARIAAAAVKRRRRKKSP